MTTRPVRRSLAALAASLLLVPLAGCGDDGSDGSGSSDVLDEGQLEEALIGADDLPDGFTVDEDEEDDDSETGTCLDDLDGFEEAEDLEPENEAEVEFAQETDQGQSSVSATVESYSDDERVGRAIDTFLGLAQDCTLAQGESDGVTYDLKITTSEEEVVTGADRQVTVGVTGTFAAQGQEFPARFGFVVASVGNDLAAVSVSEVGAGQSIVDQLASIAQTQLDRLSDAG